MMLLPLASVEFQEGRFVLPAHPYTLHFAYLGDERSAAFRQDVVASEARHKITGKEGRGAGGLRWGKQANGHREWHERRR